MKHITFSGRDHVYIIVLLQDFKAACDLCTIHEDATLSLLNHFFTESVNSGNRARGTLPTETVNDQ